MKNHGCGVTGCYSGDSIYHNPARGGPPFDPGATEARVIDTGSKWIVFRLLDVAVERKTFQWDVQTKGDVRRLGLIKWYGAWRSYAFFPRADCLFEPTCLRDLAAFIDARMADRREK